MVHSRPAIVRLGLLLPDRSGLEIMADLKEGFPNHPPVVILSNYGEPTMIDRGISLGALEYLVKSRVTPSSVSQAIRGWIEQARQGRSEPQKQSGASRANYPRPHCSGLCVAPRG